MDKLRHLFVMLPLPNYYLPHEHGYACYVSVIISFYGSKTQFGVPILDS